MSRHRIIVNPIAGRGAGDCAAPQIEVLLGEHGLDFDLVRTRQPWDAAELARQAVADGYGCVVAVGGDGTVNEVINGLMRAKHEGLGTCTMGMLCVGPGNDFAYGVEIPQDLEAGIKAPVQGHRRWIDVGRVVVGLYAEGRYFGNGVGIGFDAVVGLEAVKMTWLHGFASYLVAVLKTVLLYFSAPPTSIEYDGQTITQPSLMISIMNGRRMAAAF